MNSGIDKILIEISSLATDTVFQTVLLTGGRSANTLYRQWSAHLAFVNWQSSTFYFGDERCVSAEHPDSNYQMAVTAFSGTLNKSQLQRIVGDAANPNNEAVRYDALLPDMIDLALFSPKLIDLQ